MALYYRINTGLPIITLVCSELRTKICVYMACSEATYTCMQEEYSKVQDATSRRATEYMVYRLSPIAIDRVLDSPVGNNRSIESFMLSIVPNLIDI